MEAAVLTATIQAYNKASLTGDVPNGVTVDFTNSSGSKGKVGQGQTALLTIANWPHATLHSITLYARSNKASGAATVTITLGDSTWIAAEGAYAEWPGMTDYSQTDLPLSMLPQAMVAAKGAALSIKVEGSVNSVNLTQVVVDYTEALPVPSALTLLSINQEGQLQTQQLVEQQVGDGFVLPSVGTDSVLTYDGDKWYWLGWTEKATDKQTVSPVYWGAGDWYSCADEGKLYALYTNSPQVLLHQDTSFVSGNYAMITEFGNHRLALSGTWVKGKIDTEAIALQKSSKGEWLLPSYAVSEEMIYELSFIGDSLTIYHTYSQSWIGYATTSGSKKLSVWAWRRMGDGTILICQSAVPTGTDILAKCLYVDSEDLSFNAFYAYYKEIVFPPSFACWRLFPISNTERPISKLFTTFPEITPIRTAPAMPSNKAGMKQMDQNGKLLIIYNQHKFNIKGEYL